MKVLLLAVLSLLVGTAAAQQGPSAAPHKIIMQMTSGDTAVFKGLIKQLNNLENGWGDSVDIEVVCHGPGLDFLRTDKNSRVPQVAALQNKGVRFVVCENTLIERKINRDLLMPNMEFVRMGIAEVVTRQEGGWSYIKAGN